MTKAETEELADSVTQLIGEIEAGNMVASTAMLHRLQGALAALRLVLGQGTELLAGLEPVEDR